MLTVQIEADPYVGTLYLGRIHSGVLRAGDFVWALDSEGQKVGEGRVKKIFGRKGLERVEKPAAGPGEIISIAGIKNGGVNVTLVHPEGWGEDGPKPISVSPLLSPPFFFDLFLFLPAVPTYRPTYHFTPPAAQRLSPCGSFGLQTNIPAHTRANLQRGFHQPRPSCPLRPHLRLD